MPRPDAIDYPIDQIREWIANDWTQQKIADELKRALDPRVTAKLIYKVCKKHGIACQRTGPRNGPGHPFWEGGRHFDKSGYISVYCPDHPSCAEKNARKKLKFGDKYFEPERYVLEHRLVVEKTLGRYLLPNEVVHHINGVKDDNRPENLIVFQTNAEHLAHDLKGKCPEWSQRGKLLILIGVQKRSARVLQKKGLDAQVPLQKIAQLTAELEALGQTVS